MEVPWEHPDWYDLHDTTWTAGPEREPEHYRELLLSLPPLDRQDHLIDVGAGTGKLASLIARGYPHIGRVTLIEPNIPKLERARSRLAELLPGAHIDTLPLALGEERDLPRRGATVVTVGSVLMPIMEARGGSLAAGLGWLRAALRELAALLSPEGWLYDLETLGAPWARGSVSDPVRRLSMTELCDEFSRGGFEAVECVYRFRDRVVLRARHPGGDKR
jgi:SAM-dependent methyltransferase